MEENKEYYAFISYKREDEKWAKWLQDKLEHYKFPTNLNGRTDLPKNIRPTFRDVTDLEPGLLAEKIDNALRNSEWLIVVCSPRSAKSPWVCKEAQTFIDLGRADRIIPFVIEGNPFSDDIATECFPEALRNLTGNKELLAANINEMGRDAAVIKVVARMFGLRFDTLWQRHEREMKRNRIVAGGMVILLLILAGGIILLVNKKNRQLAHKNALIEKQNFNLEKQNVEQLLNLADNNLLQNRMGLSVEKLIKIYGKKDVLDSLKLKQMDNLMRSIEDTMNFKGITLVGICDTTNNIPLSTLSVLKAMPFITFVEDEESIESDYYVFFINKEKCVEFIDDYVSHVIVNPNKTLVVVYDELFSLEDGHKIEHDASKYHSGGLNYMQDYPIALSNNGQYLIFRRGARDLDETIVIDFLKDREHVVYDRDGLGEYENKDNIYFIGGFSPDDSYYFLAFEGKICLYATKDNKKIQEIPLTETSHNWDDSYDEIPKIFWEKGNVLVVQHGALLFKWQIYGPKEEWRFSTLGNTTVIDITISSKGKYAAVLYSNNIIEIWNLYKGELLYRNGRLLEYPTWAEFTHDETQLWVTGQYNHAQGIDISTLSPFSITLDRNYNFDYPPENGYLFFTEDDKYCIEVRLNSDMETFIYSVDEKRSNSSLCNDIIEKYNLRSNPLFVQDYNKVFDSESMTYILSHSYEEVFFYKTLPNNSIKVGRKIHSKNIEEVILEYLKGEEPYNHRIGVRGTK